MFGDEISRSLVDLRLRTMDDWKDLIDWHLIYSGNICFNISVTRIISLESLE